MEGRQNVKEAGLWEDIAKNAAKSNPRAQGPVALFDRPP